MCGAVGESGFVATLPEPVADARAKELQALISNAGAGSEDAPRSANPHQPDSWLLLTSGGPADDHGAPRRQGSAGASNVGNALISHW
jgi:hypothetical protein